MIGSAYHFSLLLNYQWEIHGRNIVLSGKQGHKINPLEAAPPQLLHPLKTLASKPSIPQNYNKILQINLHFLLLRCSCSSTSTSVCLALIPESCKMVCTRLLFLVMHSGLWRRWIHGRSKTICSFCHCPSCLPLSNVAGIAKLLHHQDVASLLFNFI